MLIKFTSVRFKKTRENEVVYFKFVDSLHFTYPNCWMSNKSTVGLIPEPCNVAGKCEEVDYHKSKLTVLVGGESLNPQSYILNFF